MYIEIDFNSDEALYLQLCNQIILGIATSQLSEGDVLPSVRALADTIGINMHTVNKAYSVLRQEGYLKVDRRRGAVIALDLDHAKALEDLKESLKGALARSMCKSISRQEVHGLIDEIYGEYDAEMKNPQDGKE
ncbi:MAG: GntR family transcriptional regulator [Lachnospiraceae bacterium]|jgi:DNA-binding transcriptional regulator YhcF (GntR family)|nr:GntR family transcriptional regulator [Lachnospiraceae bacterium]